MPIPLNRDSSALDGDAAIRFGLFGEVFSLSLDVDAVTDQLLNDTDRAARKQAAEDRLVEAEKQLQEISQAQVTLALRVNQLDATWQALWQPTNIIPRKPADMVQWHRYVATIIERQNKLPSHVFASRYRMSGASVASCLRP